MTAIQYLIISTISISILYFTYLLLFKNETNFKQLRFYLLVSVFISLLIPLNTFHISTDFITNGIPVKIKQKTEINQSVKNDIKSELPVTLQNPEIKKTVNISWKQFLLIFYISIVSFFIIRICLQLILLFMQLLKSRNERNGNYILVYNQKYKNIFSFFNLIFIPEDNNSDLDIQQIITHEKIHVQQYHTFDIILIDLLAAVMWFNPLVWMMRNSIHLVHEYLADEGVLSTGIDKLEYQALLINQVTEERLICLSSSFNHSLIKKRMIMMTKSKFNQHTKLRILALIPLTAILFFSVACVKGQEKTETVAAVAPVKMNVMYLGTGNPVKIAVSGYKPSELEIKMTNASFEGSNGSYMVFPKRLGNCIVEIYADNELLQKTEFRVKPIPDPVAMVGEIGGNATLPKEHLLKQDEVRAVMRNFDFDLNFEVVEFAVSATVKGFVREYKAKGNKITKEQKDFISSLNSGEKVYFEFIKIKGPDGVIRELPALAFKIDGE